MATKKNPTLYQNMQPYLTSASIGGVVGGLSHFADKLEGGFIVSTANVALFGICFPIIFNGLEQGLSLYASTLATYHATRLGGTLGKGQVVGVSLQAQPESPKKGDIQAPSGNIKKLRAGGKVYDLVFDRNIKIPKSISHSTTKKKINTRAAIVITGDCSHPKNPHYRKGQITGAVLWRFLRQADKADIATDYGKSMSERSQAGKRFATDDYWLIRNCIRQAEQLSGIELVAKTGRWERLKYSDLYTYNVVVKVVLVWLPLLASGKGVDLPPLPAPPLPRGYVDYECE